MRNHLSLLGALIAASVSPLLLWAVDQANTAPEATATVMPTRIPARDLDLLPTFEAVMRDVDEDCSLPCWWGFEIGKTSLEEVSAFLQETGFDREWRLSPYRFALEQYMRYGEPFNLDFTDSYYMTGKSFQIAFLFDRRRVLTHISIEFWSPNAWLLPDLDRASFPYLLTHIDDKPEIYIHGRSYPGNNTIFLIYRGPDMLVVYDFDEGDDYVPGQRCLNFEHTESIRMTIPQRELFQPVSDDDVYVSPERLFNISTETFAQFFQDHPGDCLDIAKYEGL